FFPATGLGLNRWTLAGRWGIDADEIDAAQPGARLAYRFRARDLHLVLGPSPDGKPVRIKVTIDGKAPAADHASDIAAEGTGLVDAHRLSQLVRQGGGAAERTFEIEFLDAGARAYAFTFG